MNSLTVEVVEGGQRESSLGKVYVQECHQSPRRNSQKLTAAGQESAPVLDVAIDQSQHVASGAHPAFDFVVIQEEAGLG